MNPATIVLWGALLGLAAWGQASQDATRFWDAAGRPLPLQSDEAIESFLAAAEVESLEALADGVSGAHKARLESGGLRLHAVFRDVHLETPGRPRPSGRQIVLRDDSIFEMAAYRLDRLLGIGRVPPVVQRTIDGHGGTLQLWIENAVTEKGRRGRQMPTTESMELAWQQMLLFDNLIFNDDRNRGNVVYDSTGRLWMIDHTRAFRDYLELPYPEAVEKCERNLWQRLQRVSDKELAATVGPYLKPAEVKALIQRRRMLVEHVEALIGEHGAEQVLYSPPSQ